MQKSMSDNLIAIWHSSCEVEFTAIVLPDGCRDLIVKTVAKERPQWLISPLFDRSKPVLIEADSKLQGFRLKPGVNIDAKALLGALSGTCFHADDVQNLIEDFTHLDPTAEEALACLASDVESIKEASHRLGVSVRTLQRLLLKKTERSPGYWFQLARARKAARRLTRSARFVDVAEMYGFSDQSHMNREFRRWFRASPSELLKTPAIIEQLNAQAYG